MKKDRIDKKLEAIGFEKISDDKYSVTYKKYIKKYDYTHILAILHKTSGRHIIQSYSHDAAAENKCFSSCVVGLTGYETKLILAKMKRKGWYSR